MSIAFHHRDIALLGLVARRLMMPLAYAHFDVHPVL